MTTITWTRTAKGRGNAVMVSIPKEIRDSFGIVHDTDLEFYVDGDKIIMKKKET